MTTANDLCLQALKKAGILGIGQSANSEDVNDAFADLNDMLAQWQRKRWLVWNLIDAAVTSTGAEAYTVGPCGDFDIGRPDRIESAFFRQLTQSSPNQVDYPLEIIQAREDYNLIALKSLSTWPQCVFYDSAYPVGSLYVYPVPQASLYSIHISVKQPLGPFSSLTAAVSLPPEYNAAIKFNLALRLRQGYQLPSDPELTALAKDSLNLIRGANAQIPLLQMPDGISRRGRYNILSDQGF